MKLLISNLILRFTMWSLRRLTVGRRVVVYRGGEPKLRGRITALALDRDTVMATATVRSWSPGSALETHWTMPLRDGKFERKHHAIVWRLP